LSWPISCGVKEVIAVGTKPIDASKLREPPIRTPSCQDGDELDGLGDQRAWNRDYAFLDQLLHPSQRAQG
jgi:hypothetical protein